MSTHRNIDIICIAVTVLTLAAALLLMTVKRSLTEATPGNDAAETTVLYSPDYSGAAKAVFKGDSADIKGSGAYFENGSLTIAAAGSYILSGELDNGSVIVSADKKSEINIMLSGASISTENGAAILVEQAKSVTLTLEKNTENTITGGKFSADEKTDGAVYSHDDLIIGGGGSLEVVSEYGHGIVCNDELVFCGGTVEVDAKDDAVHANDGVTVNGASLELTAGDDGITASNDENTSFVLIESGTVTIDSCYEGLEACTVRINGGDITVYPEDDGLNANNGERLIEINGGNVTVINKNGRDSDGFDSNGDIIINGGNVFISVPGTGSNTALDYGSENGGKCLINGGTVAAFGSSAMTESVSADSAQGFIMQSVSGSADAPVSLSKNNEKLLDVTVPSEFSLMLLSAPGMALNDTVTVCIGEESAEYTVDNSFAGGSQFGFPGNFIGGKEDFRGNGEGKTPPDDFTMPEGERPELPQGETPQAQDGEPPQRPDGEMPQMPQGEMPQRQEGEPPQRPDGEMPQMQESEIPQKPEGEPPQPPGGKTASG